MNVFLGNQRKSDNLQPLARSMQFSLSHNLFEQKY